MKAYKDRLRVFDEENQQAIQEQHKFQAKAPLPSQQYRDDLNRLLENHYKHGIYTSGKKVAERLCAQFIRPTAEAAVQVDDIMAKKMQDRIEELEDQIALMQEEYQRGFNENKELRERVADLTDFNKKLMNEFAELQKEYDMFSKNQNQNASLLKRLQEEVLQYQSENNELK